MMSPTTIRDKLCLPDKSETFYSKTLFSLVMGFLFILSSNANAWDAAAYNAGESTGAAMQSRLNSTGKIRQRFSNPMTSNGTAMSTMDDSQSFTSQLMAPSSDIFLDIFAAPSASGDITTLTINQDTNFSGTSDYAYSLSSPVSGVCSNGFISADAGTWNNRHYYVWSADSSGRVSAVEVPSMMSLAGCYCINASCGSNLSWTNIDLILRDLGGGVVSAIQQQTSFTITNVDITGTEIKYYGQESDTMGDTTGVYFSGTATPQQYYAGGGGTLPGDAELANQAGDPNSIYSQLNVLNNKIGNQYTTKQCSIKRQVQLTPQMDMVGYDVTFYVGYDSDGSSKQCFWATNTGACRDVWILGGGWTGCQNLNLSHLGNIVHSIVATGVCIPYTDPVSGGSGCFSPPGTINVHSYQFVQRTGSGTNPGCYGSDNDSTHQYWHIRAFTVDNIDEYTLTTQGNLIIGVKDNPGSFRTGSCAALDLTDCAMMEETVCDYVDSGCIYTYRNYNPTGLAPLGSCEQVQSPNTGLNWTFCADGSKLTYQEGASSGVLESGTDVWWNIHRTYSCETNNVFDFTNAQQRAGHIQNTLSDNGGTLTFQDFNPDTGATTNNSISLPPRQDVERCEKSCIVKIPVQDTQASLTGTTADYRTSVNTNKEILRACANGACPVNAGEVLIKDCLCTNYFNQAATTLQLIHDAGRDMICSVSPP